MNELTAQSALRPFLVLTALRWLPLGLLMPVFVLLPLERGLSVSEIGLALSFQGFVVLAIEVPTGGLADSIGRRRVLLASAAASFVSIGVFALADNFAVLACAAALLGVYRALDSGPLEAWYIDECHARDPQARIDIGIGWQNTVMGVSMGLGGLASAALVTWKPVPAIEPLLVPVLMSLVVQVVGAAAIWALMDEHRPASSGATGIDRLWSDARKTPHTIASGVRLIRASPVLMALVSVEIFWGFGSATFENLFPVRLAEVTVTPESAAAITGIAVAVGWLASSVGAVSTARLAQRWGTVEVALLLRVLQGATVAGMGLFAGVAGVLAAYVACYLVHGTSNAAHMTLLHRHATGEVRTTVMSVNSMMAQGAGAIGLIILSSVAEHASVSAAMYVGGLVLAAAAPLYLFARQTEPTSRQAVRIRK